MAKIAQRKLLGETSRLEISSKSPGCCQDRVKTAFLLKSLPWRFQDGVHDVAKIGPRKLSW